MPACSSTDDCHDLGPRSVILDQRAACIGAQQVGQLTRNGTSPALEFGQALLQDGAWHMLTLSTFYDDTPGYAMFLDGQLTAEIDGNLSYIGMALLPMHPLYDGSSSSALAAG